MSTFGPEIIKRFPERSPIHDADNLGYIMIDESVGVELDTMLDQLLINSDARFLETAKGIFLDKYGEWFGLKRENGIDQTQTDDTKYINIEYNDNNHLYRQSFTPTKSKFKGIELKLWKNYLVTDDLKISIYDIDGVTLLDEQIIDTSDLTVSSKVVRTDFDLVLVPGNKYYFYLSRTGPTNMNSFGVDRSNTDNYSRGEYEESTNGGTSYTTKTYDLWFKTYSTIGVSESDDEYRIKLLALRGSNTSISGIRGALSIILDLNPSEIIIKNSDEGCCRLGKMILYDQYYTGPTCKLTSQYTRDSGTIMITVPVGTDTSVAESIISQMCLPGVIVNFMEE